MKTKTALLVMLCSFTATTFAIPPRLQDAKMNRPAPLPRQSKEAPNIRCSPVSLDHFDPSPFKLNSSLGAMSVSRSTP
jgi:hypothetical protein